VIFLVTLGGLGLVRPSFAAFVCAVSDSCATGVTVMRLWNVAGSHAEMSTQANYPKYVCCSGVDGLGNSCTGNHAVVARLSSATNAHVETNASSDYANLTCLSLNSGTVTVGYQSGNCNGFQTTVASISAQSNAHIGDGSAYTLKICASVDQTATVVDTGGGGLGSGNGGILAHGYAETPTTTPPFLDNGLGNDAASIDARVATLASLGFEIHDLVKLPDDGNPLTQQDSTVYYLGADGRRHAFPNPSMYFSWYCDFSNVRIISATALAQIPLGRNIVYRPGIRLVKFQTDPKVYLVQASGLLRPLADEATARAIAGSDWNKLVADISDAFYLDYAIGTPITLAEASSQDPYLSVHEYPSAEMGILGYVDPGAVPSLVCTAPPAPPSSWPFSHIPKTFSFAHQLDQTSTFNTDIRYLQELLTFLGPNIYPEAQVTGNFGVATTAAVKRFQKAHGLTQNGIVGSGTRQALNSILDTYR